MTEWKATREAIAADYRRLAAYYRSIDRGGDHPPGLRLGFLAMLLYRIAHYLHGNGWRLAARLFWLANICLTGAEIDSASSIGKGMIIPYPRTVTIFGIIGDNCTFLGQSGMGGMLRAPPGLPVVDDNVLVMHGSIIQGPVRVGRGARIGPRCIVTKNVPQDG